MKCPKCNREVNNNEFYCPDCGSYLYVKKDNKKLIIISLVIAIVLGSVGIYYAFFRKDLSEHGELSVNDEVTINGILTKLRYVRGCDEIYDRYNNVYISDSSKKYIVAYFEVVNLGQFSYDVGNVYINRYLDSKHYTEEELNNVGSVDNYDALNIMRLDAGYHGYVMNIMEVDRESSFEDIDYEINGNIWHITPLNVGKKAFDFEYYGNIYSKKTDNLFTDAFLEVELLDYEVLKDDYLSLKLRIKNLNFEYINLSEIAPYIKYYIDGCYQNDLGDVFYLDNYDVPSLYEIGSIKKGDEYIFHLEVKYKQGIYDFIFEDEYYKFSCAFDIK